MNSVSDISNDENGHAPHATPQKASHQDGCPLFVTKSEKQDTIEDQGTAFLRESHKQEHQVSFSPWPKDPQLLRKRKGWDHLTLSFDVIVTLLPVIFLALSIAALSLDGQPISTFGNNIIEVSKYGTTAFPIVFTAIIARFMRATALWRCEKGVSLGLLEQLVGSQSLASTVEHFVVLRQHNFFAIVMIPLWLLSPFGSQMTLRLLQLGDSETLGSTPVRYFNLTNNGSIQGNTGFASNEVGRDVLSPQGIQVYRSALTALVGASLLSSDDVRTSAVDQWGSLKIPQFSEGAGQNGTIENPWIPIDNVMEEWSSLSGVMTVDVPLQANSTFLIETAYINVSCPNPVTIPLNGGNGSDGSSNFTFGDFNLTIRGPPLPWYSQGFLGDETHSNSAFLNTLATNDTWLSNAPNNLIYGSVLTPDHVSEGEVDSLEIFNCSFDFPKLEVNITCIGKSCRATDIRRSEFSASSRYVPPFHYVTYEELLSDIPDIIGYAHLGDVSPLDYFMLGHDNPYSLGGGYSSQLPNYSNVSGVVFGKRLTTLMNTVWQAVLCPHGIGLGSSANLSACILEDTPEAHDLVATSVAITRTTYFQSRYVTTKWHAAVLLVLSVFLQIAAIISLIISTLTKAPDILGYVSSLTRDSPYTRVPVGGDTLDGADRARCLADTKVCIADVRPGEDVGHIAFCTIGDDRQFSVEKLRKGRSYA